MLGGAPGGASYPATLEASCREFSESRPKLLRLHTRRFGPRRSTLLLPTRNGSKAAAGRIKGGSPLAYRVGESSEFVRSRSRLLAS